MKLTREQITMINDASEQKSIICKACWGAGKTTTLIEIYKKLKNSRNNINILYLTYNKKLKEDARNKFDGNSIHNFDSFALELFNNTKIDIKVGGGEYSKPLANEYIELIPIYDVILIDEVQDLKDTHLKIIEQFLKLNPNTQFIIVGDENQKIYSTGMNSIQEIKNIFKKFNKEYEELNLTDSFRLNKSLANLLSNIYNRPIVGKNNKLSIEFSKNIYEVAENLNDNYDIGDILILGSSSKGDAKHLQNILEDKYKNKFNKKTVYSSTSDDNVPCCGNVCNIISYDRCKGMERKVVVLCDFNLPYFQLRSEHTSFGLNKNLFCVALTRAKEKLIILETEYKTLPIEYLKYEKFQPKISECLSVTELITHKPSSLTNQAFSYIKIESLCEAQKICNIKLNDNLIDTSAIVGSYIQPLYFKHYNLEDEFDLFNIIHKGKKYIKYDKNSDLIKNLKILAAAETSQKRYEKAEISISTQDKKLIRDRFHNEGFNSEDSKNIQLECSLALSNGINLKGIIDAKKQDTIYEFKFVKELTGEHILQLATYLLMNKTNNGILYNLRDNSKLSIKISDKKKFKKIISELAMYTGDIIKTNTSNENLSEPLEYYLTTSQIIETKTIKNSDRKKQNINNKNRTISKNRTIKKFAIIDIETDYNRNPISIGIIISDNKYKELDSKYYIVSDINNGMYSNIRTFTSHPFIECSLSEMIKNVKQFLDNSKVKDIFAYSTKNTEYNILSKFAELSNKNYNYYDIMQYTRNKIFNEEFCNKTPKGKVSSSVESVFKQLTKNKNYTEKHIAIDDASDELTILRLLNIPLNQYDIVS